MIKSAIFSQDRVYRYVLERTWEAGPKVMIIGLNPSTADETVDDPTIRRCINFAKSWGFSGLYMTNLFAYRATKPADMLRADDPMGLQNDEWVLKTAAECNLVVAAWGAHGGYQERDEAMVGLLSDAKLAGGKHCELHVIALTNSGHPRHPLYLPKHLKPARWEGVL